MARPFIEAMHYTGVPLEEGTGPFAGAMWHVLSRDNEDAGAFTTVARLPAGFRTIPAADRSYELLVLSGEVRVGGCPVAKGIYAYMPVDHSPRDLEATQPAMVYLWFGALGRGGGDPMVVDPETIQLNVRGIEVDADIDEDLRQDQGGSIANLAKTLRRDPITGDVTVMGIMYPGQHQDCAEDHVSADEGLILRGDMLTLDPTGNPAELVAGSYVWRPVRARHLPKYSHNGCLAIFRNIGWEQDPQHGWTERLKYYPEPRWPQILEEYKAKQRFF